MRCLVNSAGIVVLLFLLDCGSVCDWLFWCVIALGFAVGCAVVFVGCLLLGWLVVYVECLLVLRWLVVTCLIAILIYVLIVD